MSCIKAASEPALKRCPISSASASVPFVAAPATLADTTSKALEFQRVKVLPTGSVDDLRGRVEQAAIRLQRLHRIAIHRHAGRLAVAADRTPQKHTFAGAHGLALRRNLNHQHDLPIKSDDFDAHCQCRARTPGDQRGQLVSVGSGAVARARTGDAAIVLNADQQPGRVVANTVGEADYGLDELTVVQGRALLALELGTQGFTVGDQTSQGLGVHCTPFRNPARSS